MEVKRGNKRFLKKEDKKNDGEERIWYDIVGG